MFESMKTSVFKCAKIVTKQKPMKYPNNDKNQTERVTENPISHFYNPINLYHEKVCEWLIGCISFI